MPTTREWLFSIKTFAAAMLALGIGFAADLDRPYWAMATVYIASQPFSGATRSKAVYRFMGTLLGATAAVVLVPTLVNAPPLLSAALAGWIAVCLIFSLLDRGPHGYVFMLAGYTAAIIGFPSVDAPAAIWATALARFEEISLGIACATLVSTLVLPRSLAPALAIRAAAWLADARATAATLLRDALLLHAAPAPAHTHRRLITEAMDIGAMTAHLAFDQGAHGGSVDIWQALHTRMTLLLPLLSSIADRTSALRDAGGMDPATAAVLRAVAAWLATAAPQADLQPLRARIDAAAGQGTSWSDVMRAGLLIRLRELIDLFADAHALTTALADATPRLPPLTHGDTLDTGRQQHTDVPMALLSGAAAALAVGLICLFWIASAWTEGAIAAEMAAVVCCFFAGQDDPGVGIASFLRWTIVAVLVDAAYLFAVLPMVDGFAMLALVLAPSFLLFGLLAARPATAPIGLALAANGATLMALQSTYSADFANFANVGVAAVIGMSASLILTRVVRTVGVEWSAWHLVGLNWRLLADAASRRGQGDRGRFASLILDRVGLVTARLAAIAPDRAPDLARLFAEVRIGLNIVDLRRARHSLPPSAVHAIDRTLGAVATHFRGRPGTPPCPEPLLPLIDTALRIVSAHTGAGRDDALLGLVGLRLGLFHTEAAPAAPMGSGSDLPMRHAA
jgi:uncharacterized membrane protein YccC